MDDKVDKEKVAALIDIEVAVTSMRKFFNGIEDLDSKYRRDAIKLVKQIQGLANDAKLHLLTQEINSWGDEEWPWDQKE